MIIGNKINFAIEINVTEKTPSIKGRSRIWLESEPIGNFESIEALYPLINSLHVDRRWIENKSIPEINYDYFKDKQDLFNYLLDFSSFKDMFQKLVRGESDVIKSFDRIAFSASENFDNYIIRRFISDGNVIFVWRAAPLTMVSEIKVSKISVNSFCSTVNELEKLTDFRPQNYFFD